ncbi:MAG: acyl-CoA dehydratase activase-related protein [Bacillota bacterium]|nr:acyl-CoA dehydratase activase-related protein [Bacillota bacterium]MDW7685321.1 acyl-CoA dehydratase activase-related protein [Bacillota bacterium]
MRVGIPSTLSFFTFYPLWKPFFEGLGVEVVTSPVSNKGLLDEGVKETVNDACVPIKLFHGHVAVLKDKVDVLFLPRLVSLDGKNTLCPKFLGLPDMVRYSINGLPDIIEDRLDLKKGKLELYRFMYRVGKRFTDNKLKIACAIWQARYNFARYRKLLLHGLTPAEAFPLLESGEAPKPRAEEKPIKLAVLGYPYALYDNYISVGLLEKLKEQDVSIVTPEMVPENVLKKMGKRLPKNLFWYYSNRVVWASLYFLRDRSVDGIIHVTAFGCGPDAMTNKLVELEAKEQRQIPFLSVTIDEHTGEAGVATRVEAFVDLLKRKKGIL